MRDLQPFQQFATDEHVSLDGGSAILSRRESCVIKILWQGYRVSIYRLVYLSISCCTCPHPPSPPTHLRCMWGKHHAKLASRSRSQGLFCACGLCKALWILTIQCRECVFMRLCKALFMILVLKVLMNYYHLGNVFLCGIYSPFLTPPPPRNIFCSVANKTLT